MNRHRMIASVAAGILCGCMQFNFDLTANRVPIPVLMNAPAERPFTIITHFKIEQEAGLLFIERLVGGAQPDLNVLLLNRPEVLRGDAIVNLKVTGRTAFRDILFPVVVGVAGTFVFPLFSLFIFEPFFTDLKTVTIEGDLIRYTDVDIKKKVFRKIDPNTGLPVQEFDPDTGLPK